MDKSAESPPPCRSSPRPWAPLGSYLDREARRRELVTIRAARGTTIVLDRDAATLADSRLVAHLGAEEPPGNAALVCRHYLADAAGRWCRPLRVGDLLAPAPGDDPWTAPSEAAAGDGDAPDPPAGAPDPLAVGEPAVSATGTGLEAGGWRYCLLDIRGERASRQLRWCRRQAESPTAEWEQVSLREIVGALERYEPMRSITARALAAHGKDPGLALRRLGSEYERLCTSPIVLNRALREAVAAAIRREGLSLSELALRCGIVKRDRRGQTSGETSWLARRIGLMAESGREGPSPWIHSDVLALIARRALRVSPREVEVP